ncbi:Metal tolerance protein 8 [Ceratocystis lukuohia]|uniref:Zinc transporter n=1 Tax=Ceratocystis lukuohia TaxID=2019550 RepID=A0ABR4MPX0_9PEZI
MAHHESSGSPLLALISHPPFTHTHSSSHSSSHSQSHSRSFSSASASEPVPASAPTPAVRSFSGGYTSTGTQKFSTAISGPSPSRSVSASLTHLQPGQHHYTSHVHTSPQHRHPQNLSQNSHPAYADSNNSLQQPLLHYQRSRSRSPRPHSPLRYQQTSSSSSLDISTNNCHTKTASTSNSTHTRHLSLHNNYSTYSPSHNRGYGHASSSSASLPQYNSGYGYGFSSANTASSTTGTLSSRKMGAHSHSPSQLREVTPITIDDFSSANTSQLSLSTSASGFDKMGAHGHKHRGHGPEKISGDFVDDHGSSHDDTHKNEGGHGNSCSHDHGHNHKHDHGHDHHHHDHHHHDHKHGHDHDHDHDHVHFHAHAHSSMDDKSRVTKFLLGYTSSYPFLNAIMIEKDSRRILYYMLLNISFMMVQAFYGYVTDSLGLLSDTVHMFFDCMALLVGLVASVLGKRPPSQRFPYGLGKIETLSGFANGILLVLLSVEITFEAFERIWEGTETKRLGELLAVSVMGMVVNLVGMFAFGHHHHGHSHGGHDHSHGDGGCGGHDNENMQGIYLHVLADTLGSASVVVSTLLTYFTGHSFWDQLASVFISVLILGSSKPLIMSAARRLLLGIPDNIEYNLRNTLSGIAQQRGVLAYSVPKFWMDDRLGRENRLLGFVHVVAVKGASLEDVRDRVQNYLSQHNMDIVVQVEREGDASCWCDIGRAASGLALANASSLRPTFSSVKYVDARPHYPTSLVDRILKYHGSNNPRQSLIDIGCGPGNAALAFAGKFNKIVGVDPSEKMIEQASELSSKYPSMSFQVSLAEDLHAFPDAAFDMAVAGQSAHWFNNTAALSEIARVVRPGGCFALWGYNDNILVGYPEATAIFHDFLYRPDGEVAPGMKSMAQYWEQPGREILRTYFGQFVMSSEHWGEVTRKIYKPDLKTCQVAPGDAEQSGLWLEKRLTLGEFEAYQRINDISRSP